MKLNIRHNSLLFALIILLVASLVSTDAFAKRKRKHHSEKQKSAKRESTKKSKTENPAQTAASSAPATAQATAAPATTQPKTAAAATQPMASPQVAKRTGPVKIAVIDVSEKKGTNVTKAFQRAYEKTKDYTIIDSKTAEQSAKNFSLKVEDLRTKEARQIRKVDIRNLMKDLDADIIVFVDVFKRGRRAKVTAIDYDIEPVATFSRRIRGYKISGKLAQKTVEKSTPKIDTAVKEFREKGGFEGIPLAPAAKPQVVTATKPASESIYEEDTDESDDTIEDDEVELGETGYFRFGVAGFYGNKKITLTAANATSIYSANYYGVMATLGSTFWQNDFYSIGVSGIGGFAPYKTTLSVKENGQTSENQTNSYFAFAHLQLELGIQPAEGFFITPFVGGSFNWYKIKKILYLQYSGEQYIGMRAGFNLNYVVAGANIGLGFAVNPYFKKQFSDNYYGDFQAFPLAYDAKFTFNYQIIPLLEIFAGYQFRYMSNTMGKSSNVFIMDYPKLTDMSHLIWVGLGLTL